MPATRSARLLRTMKSALVGLERFPPAPAAPRLLVARLDGHPPALAGDPDSSHEPDQREFLLDDCSAQITSLVEPVRLVRGSS